MSKYGFSIDLGAELDQEEQEDQKKREAVAAAQTSEKDKQRVLKDGEKAKAEKQKKAAEQERKKKEQKERESVGTSVDSISPHFTEGSADYLPSQKKRSRIVPILFLLIIIGAIIGLYWQGSTNTHDTESTAFTPNQRNTTINAAVPDTATNETTAEQNSSQQAIDDEISALLLEQLRDH